MVFYVKRNKAREAHETQSRAVGEGFVMLWLCWTRGGGRDCVSAAAELMQLLLCQGGTFLQPRQGRPRRARACRSSAMEELVGRNEDRLGETMDTCCDFADQSGVLSSPNQRAIAISFLRGF